jgi:hypothetical protein
MNADILSIQTPKINTRNAATSKRGQVDIDRVKKPA